MHDVLGQAHRWDLGSKRWLGTGAAGLLLAAACTTSRAAGGTCGSGGIAGDAATMLTCPQSVEQYCSTAESCPPNAWSAVQEDMSGGIVNGRVYPGQAGSCGSANAVLASWSPSCGDDAGLVFLFDRDSGRELAAVEIFGDGTETCLGGSGSIAFLSGCGGWAAPGSDAGTLDE